MMIDIWPRKQNYLFLILLLTKFGEGGGYLLFIFRGQRSYATIFTGVKLGYKRRVKGKTGTTQVKKERKRTKKIMVSILLSMDVRMLGLSFIFTIANESVM